MAQWLTYPGTDLSRSFPSHDRMPDAPFLSRDRIDQFLDLYLGDADPTDPAISPWFVADVAGLAPTLVQVAELDPLVDEGRAWARRLADADVPVRCTTYRGVPHAFAALPGVSRSAHRALDEGIDFLRQHLR